MTREELDAQVAAYLAAGGEIEQVERGMSGTDQLTLTERQKAVGNQLA